MSNSLIIIFSLSFLVLFIDASFVCFFQKQVKITEPIDIDKTTVTLEAEQISSGGLYVPGKDRVEFKRPERKSLLGINSITLCFL